MDRCILGDSELLTTRASLSNHAHIRKALSVCISAGLAAVGNVFYALCAAHGQGWFIRKKPKLSKLDAFLMTRIILHLASACWLVCTRPNPFHLPLLQHASYQHFCVQSYMCEVLVATFVLSRSLNG